MLCFRQIVRSAFSVPGLILRGAGGNLQDTAKIRDLLGFNEELSEPAQTSCLSRTLQQVLVPVDLCNECSPAVDYGIRLAKTLGSTLHLLHVYIEPYVLNPATRGRNCDVFKPQRQKAFAKFYNLLEKTREELPNAVGYFEYGNSERDISKIAGLLKADLIIVCAHHRKWVDHLIVGRNTSWILKGSPCPVLVIPEVETDRPNTRREMLYQ